MACWQSAVATVTSSLVSFFLCSSSLYVVDMVSLFAYFFLNSKIC